MREDRNVRKLNRWIRGTCFAAYYWLTGRRSLLKQVDRMDELHRAPRSDIDAHVRRSLYHLLNHAFRTVSYYRDFVGLGTLSESTAVSVLQKLPILSKDIIRKEMKRLISEVPGRKLRWNTSGGSTGEPIRLLQDHRMRNLSTATKFLFMRWAGHQMGEPHFLIWGVPKATFNETISLHDRIYRRIHNKTYLNCYNINDDVLRKWVDCINTRRPTLIETYADAIYELSQLIISKKLDIARPRAMITSAGVLTSNMRETIKRAFNCPILNRYGSREVSDIACSCLASDELHIDEYSHFVEIVDDNGNLCDAGVEGDILVTLFTNNTMPLIRYQIQDRGMWALGSCPCGRTTRRLVNVSGRQSDYLLASNGSKINGTALTTLLYPVSGIRRYQFRQVEKDKVVLAVVPKDGINRDFLTKEIQPPIEKLKSMLDAVSVELAIVDEISPSKSGKYRYILNDLVK
ncbi:MAG: phenylacetate--CoA ligase family protein [Phycisphaerae bacterium]|nr:phenylacetate--CoA ligase family protein [Phycisphaerae bacterium]